MYKMVFRKVEDGLVPTLKGQPGVRSQCAFVSEEGDCASVTLLDERAQAARANERVRGRGRANLRDMLPDRPEAFAGERSIAEVSRERRAGQGQGQGEPPIVVVREFADLGPAEETRETIRRHALPIIAGSPGFRAFYLFRDERDRSRGATVVLFDTRRNAMRSHEQSARVFREKAGRVAPSLLRVASGRAIVFAAAE